ncbi:hypothetical protein FGF1_28740 [Flavobacteriaceae bacterium GF1]
MKLFSISVTDFTTDFFCFGKFYPFYRSIVNTTDNSRTPNEAYQKSVKGNSRIQVITDIPPYFEIDFDKRNHDLSFFELRMYEGFLADLSELTSIDHYLRSRFSRKGRSTLRRRVKRLEHCFDVSYKLYHGDISQGEFQFLFKRLHAMLTQRFQQRGDIHLAFKDWELIQKNAMPLILAKKASLFVIRNGSEPIDICLNYHHKNIFINLIRGYDIAYSKFGLGHIDLLKQMEWCFHHNYAIFDLSRGDMPYKRQWCNVIYRFRCQVVYDKKNIFQGIGAFALANFYKFKEFLKKKKLSKLLKKVYSLVRGNKNDEIPTFEKMEFKIESLNGISKTIRKTKIDISDEAYGYLRKPIYDLQHQYTIHSHNVAIYEIDDTGPKKVHLAKIGDNTFSIAPDF